MHDLTAFEPFRASLQAHVVSLSEACGPGGPVLPRIEMTDGKRYVRLVRVMPYGTQRSAYGFIDKTNGNILFAAGWKGPAKHARGNVFKGIPLACCGQYAVRALR